MDKIAAFRRFTALLKMTVLNGCTPAEARTAATLAAQLAKKFGFDHPQHKPFNDPPPFDERSFEDAAHRFGWEYRRCGKRSCWCAKATNGKAHGPYRYSKVRRGKTVSSVYRGRA